MTHIIAQQIRKRNLLFALLSGVLLALAMPRPGIWPMAWIGLVPLLIAVRKAKPREAAFYGLVTGLVYFGTIVFWISLFGYLPWSLVALKEALFFAAFAIIVGRLRPERVGWPGYLTIPAAWTAMQWARSLGPLGFTWGSFAHTQANNTHVIQLASLAGPWLIDFMVCLVNLAIADAVAVSARRRLAIATAVTALALSWGVGFAIIRLTPDIDPTTRVAVIQGNTDQDVEPNLSYLADTYITYSRMSRRAVDEGAELVVWPETTLPTRITDANWSPLLSNLAKKTQATYIIGGCTPSSDRSSPLCHNSALFYGPDGKYIGVYNKVHLVPYGEYVPLRDYLPFLNRYPIREEDVLPGRSHNLVDTPIGRIGVSICFESLFPQISRVETKRGAHVLVVITDDSWFEHSQAARQHLMMSQLRAVENKRFVVRGAATGISAIIDPLGRTHSEQRIFKQGIASGNILPLDGLTPYTRMGDWFAYVCSVMTLAAVILTQTRMRKRG